ncbi:MAG: hypothetical protein KGS61_19475, partial [Verrucomicrobia bacterium]|nr:hypothetical protein [Verrucomicrobiota bacterium]
MLALASEPARAAEHLLWKIGEPDHSDHEFKGAVPRTTHALRVSVGTGNETRQWPRFHPGSGNGVFGGTVYRYALVFDLPGTAPTGIFYLDLDLLFRQPRVPALDLDVNGHRGRYYFEPEPMFDLGAVEDEFNPIRSSQHRRLALPASLFRAGENRLTFAAVDEPPVVIRSQNVGGAGDAGFFYDALALSHDPEAVASEELRATLQPTVFFPRTSHGVREECQLHLAYPVGWPGGRARIFIGRFTTEMAISRPAEFGEARYTFRVPPDLPAGEARIELLPGGTRRVDFKPARRWKLFYAPNEHLDVGYTDYRAKVAEVHARDMDELMTVLRRHPGYRFNLDGSWIAEQWLGSRAARATAGLAPESKAGRIGMNAFYCSVATEYPSLEENLRNLYFSKALERRARVPFDFALVSDVPSVSWCVPSLLAAAGIRYFANGGNQDRGPM